LRAENFDVHTQIPVLVTHGGFQKTYDLDLVVNQMIYELKVVASLMNDHDAQALHYAMLQDVRLVKLINFGEKKCAENCFPTPFAPPNAIAPLCENRGCSDVRLDAKAGPLVLGTHRVRVYADAHAFVVTSLSRDQDAYRQHLDILLPTSYTASAGRAVTLLLFPSVARDDS